ncbi:MAG: ABC transporter substrate-binding protein [Methanocellales archaeon]
MVRKLKKILSISIALLLLLSLVLLGCISTVPPAPKKVRVGYLLADLHQLAYMIAKNKTVGGGISFFEKYGIEVEDAIGAPYPHGGAEMDHFAAGDVDIGLLGSPPAIIKHVNANVDTVIIAQANEEGSALVVSRDIERFSDLTGKTIAVPSRSAIQFFLLLTLAEKEGVEIGKISIVDLAPKDMRAKLEAKEIDGFIAWEPFVSDAVISGTGKVLATSRDIWPNHPCCVVAVDKKFAVQNPDAVIGFLKAHVEATNYINKALKNPYSEEYKILIAIAMQFTGREEQVIKEAFKLINFKSDIDEKFKSSIVEYTEKLIQFKIISEEKLRERGYVNSTDLAEKYIDTSYLARAKQ